MDLFYLMKIWLKLIILSLMDIIKIELIYLYNTSHFIKKLNNTFNFLNNIFKQHFLLYKKIKQHLNNNS